MDHTKLKDRLVGDGAKPGRTKCSIEGCMRRLTRAECMVQWGRLMKAGLSKEEAKSVGVLCQKHTTKFLRSR